MYLVFKGQIIVQTRPVRITDGNCLIIFYWTPFKNFFAINSVFISLIQVEEEYEDEDEEDNATDDAEDPKVIKELIELIKKVGK